MNQLFYLGVKGVIVLNKRALILKRIEPTITYCDLPGGRVQEGESFEKALIREIKEELPSIGEFELGSFFHASRLDKDLPDERACLIFL